MFSKFKSILGWDTTEDTSVDEKEKDFLKSEYEKARKLKFFIFVGIAVLLIVWLWIFYKFNKKQIDIQLHRIYVSIFGFSINPVDYKIKDFDKLSWWGQVLFLKDVKTLAEANKYNPDAFKKLVKQYQSIWEKFVKNRDLENFKKEYAKFWYLKMIKALKSKNTDKSNWNNSQKSDIQSFTWSSISWDIFAWDISWEVQQLSGITLSWNVLWNENVNLTWCNNTGANCLSGKKINLSWDNFSWNLLTWAINTSWFVLTGEALELSWEDKKLTWNVLTWN